MQRAAWLWDREQACIHMSLDWYIFWYFYCYYYYDFRLVTTHEWEFKGKQIAKHSSLLRNAFCFSAARHFLIELLRSLQTNETKWMNTFLRKTIQNSFVNLSTVNMIIYDVWRILFFVFINVRGMFSEQISPGERSSFKKSFKDFLWFSHKERTRSVPALFASMNFEMEEKNLLDYSAFAIIYFFD